MTIDERKERILARIAEIKQGGSDEEKADMKAAQLPLFNRRYLRGHQPHMQGV